jgi:hypothetical protein
MTAPASLPPRALTEVACTLSMTASEVRIDCETREEAEEVFDWLEAHVGSAAAVEASNVPSAELVGTLEESVANLAVDALLAVSNWSKYNEDQADEVIYQAEKMASVCKQLIALAKREV